MKINYRPEIDGLRSIAVLAVVLFHADFAISFTLGNKSFESIKILEGGYLGVDIFFVISGYLITFLILNGIKQKSFTFLNFYERRARRILPALFIIIIASIPLSLFFLLPKQLEEYSISALTTLLFSSNIWFWIDDGYSYWAPVNEFKPLLHTWSLSIEEQFYVLFPIFLIFTVKYFRKYLIGILLVVFLISLKISEFGSENYIVANFYLLPSRGWELMAGALLAALEFSNKRSRSSKFSEIFSLIGFGLIINSFIVFDSSTSHPSYTTIYPIFGTMLIIWFSRKGEMIGDILSGRVLVFIGKISYSLYLWHFLLFSYANIYLHKSTNIWKNINLEIEFKFLIIILSFLLSIITYYFIETPFRSKQVIKTKNFLKIILISLITMLIFFTYAYQARGFTESYLKDKPFYSAYIPIEENTPPKIYNDGECKFHSTSFGALQQKKLRKCNKTYNDGLVIIGDSHAMNLYNMFYKHSKKKFIYGLSNGGCRVHDGKCHYSKILKFFKNESNSNKSKIDLKKLKVIYVQSGSYLFLDKTNMLGKKQLFKVKEVSEYDLDYNYIKKAENYILSLNNSVETIWFGPKIEPGIDPKKILHNGCQNELKLKKNIKNNYVNLDNFIKKLSSNKNYDYISQIDALNFNNKKDLFNCSEIFWRDNVHFSEAGLKRFSNRILNSLNLN